VFLDRISGWEGVIMVYRGHKLVSDDESAYRRRIALRACSSFFMAHCIKNVIDLLIALVVALKVVRFEIFLNTKLVKFM
jgi:hypothetical protein